MLNEKLESMLNVMVGKDINIYINGVITNYQCFEDFEYWCEDLITGDNLVLSSEGKEKYFYILLDEVQDVKINEDLNEIRLIFSDSILQIWIDIE